MLYIVLAIACSTGILVMFKLAGRYTINSLALLVVNYVVAVLFGIFSSPSNLHPEAILQKPWVGLAFLSGILFITGFFLFSFSAVKAGVASTGLASRLSLIVSVAAGLLIFGDSPDIYRIAGISVGLAALYLSLAPQKNSKAGASLLPIALLVVHGISDLALKVVQEYFLNDDYDAFLVSVFFIALIVSSLIFLIKYPIKTMNLKTLLAGILIGLLNWYSSYFLLLSLDRFEVSLVIPIINIGIVAAASAAGIIIFKEKLNARRLAGILIALISIALLSYPKD